MSVPPTILRLIRQINGLPLPGYLADDSVACEGAKHHSPRPLIVNEYMVHRDGLEQVRDSQFEGDSVYLCGTCADNVRVALCLYQANEGALPWSVRREFGNLVRAIAQRPYQVSV